MAADVDVVPAALLEPRDRDGVIRMRIPVGLILLGRDALPMDRLVFRGA